MSVGGVGAAGGGGGAGAIGGAASGGSAAGSVGSVGAAGAVGDSGPSEASVKGDSSDTKAVEQAGCPMQGPQMSTQDFCALRTQAAQPVQESQEIDLQKMLEWLMAIKLLEAMNKDGG